MYFLDSLQVSFLSYGQTFVCLVNIYHKRTSSSSEISYVVFLMEEDPCISGAFSKGVALWKDVRNLAKENCEQQQRECYPRLQHFRLAHKSSYKSWGTSLKKSWRSASIEQELSEKTEYKARKPVTKLERLAPAFTSKLQGSGNSNNFHSWNWRKSLKFSFYSLNKGRFLTQSLD